MRLHLRTLRYLEHVVTLGEAEVPQWVARDLERHGLVTVDRSSGCDPLVTATLEGRRLFRWLLAGEAAA